MVGFCLSQHKAAGVLIFYQQRVTDGALCQGGALLIAVLAHECGISCELLPTDFELETVRITPDLSFAGDRIAPAGVRSWVPRTDRIPLHYIGKVW